jgi:hypothetical protein
MSATIDNSWIGELQPFRVFLTRGSVCNRLHHGQLTVWLKYIPNEVQIHQRKERTKSCYSIVLSECSSVYFETGDQKERTWRGCCESEAGTRRVFTTENLLKRYNELSYSVPAINGDWGLIHPELVFIFYKLGFLAESQPVYHLYTCQFTDYLARRLGMNPPPAQANRIEPQILYYYSPISKHHFHNFLTILIS